MTGTIVLAVQIWTLQEPLWKA